MHATFSGGGESIQNQGSVSVSVLFVFFFITIISSPPEILRRTGPSSVKTWRRLLIFFREWRCHWISWTQRWKEGCFGTKWGGAGINRKGRGKVGGSDNPLLMRGGGVRDPGTSNHFLFVSPIEPWGGGFSGQTPVYHCPSGQSTSQWLSPGGWVHY